MSEKKFISIEQLTDICFGTEGIQTESQLKEYFDKLPDAPETLAEKSYCDICGSELECLAHGRRPIPSAPEKPPKCEYSNKCGDECSDLCSPVFKAPEKPMEFEEFQSEVKSAIIGEFGSLSTPKLRKLFDRMGPGSVQQSIG